MDIECEYCQISGAYGNLICEMEYWIVYLAPSQRFLGTCVIVLKRHCGNLSRLEPEEWEEFRKIVGKLETALIKAFNPALFNWSCFMNKAYRVSPPNPEIHWHFIPRYDHKIEFEGITFEDPDFGYMKHKPIREIPDNIRKEIIAKIKDNF